MTGEQHPYRLHTEAIGTDDDGDVVSTCTVQWLPQSTLSDDDDDVREPTDPWVAGLRQEKQRAAASRFKRVLYALLPIPSRPSWRPSPRAGPW